MNDTVDRIFEAHLTVRNIALSMACYRDRLGLEVAHVSPERVAFLWAGGRGRTMLGLWAASAAPQHVTNHIAFATTLADVINAPTSLERSGIGACGTRAKESDDGRARIRLFVTELHKDREFLSLTVVPGRNGDHHIKNKDKERDHRSLDAEW